MSQVKNRVIWLDNLKGFAIILVVIGHVIDGFELNGIYGSAKYAWPIFDAIYSFHMPLFFVISGFSFTLAYLEKPMMGGYCTRGRYKEQILDLLWIYVIFDVVKIVMKMVTNGRNIVDASWTDILWLPLRSVAPYWYLYVLFFMYLLTPLLVRFDARKVLIISGAVSLIFYTIVGFIDLDLTIFKVIQYAFFFLLGVYIRIGEDNLENLLIVKSIIGSVGVILAFMGYTRDNSLMGELIKFFTALFVSNSLIHIFKKHLDKKSIFAVFGLASMEIYTIHMFITRPIAPVLRLMQIDDYLLGAIVTSVLGIVVPLVIGVVMRKIYYRGISLYQIIYKPSEVMLGLKKTQIDGK